MESYYNEYISEIVPRIKDIDVLIKASEEVCVCDMARALEISEEELRHTLCLLEIENITQDNIMLIIRNSTGRICRLITREADYGMSEYYIPQQISMIYGIEKSKIEKAFRLMGIKRAKAFQLEKIFSFIG